MFISEYSAFIYRFYLKFCGYCERSILKIILEQTKKVNCLLSSLYFALGNFYEITSILRTIIKLMQDSRKAGTDGPV